MSRLIHLHLADSDYADANDLAARFQISTIEVLREGFSLLRWISQEINAGNRLLIQRGDQVAELVIAEQGHDPQARTNRGAVLRLVPDPTDE